MTSSMSMMTKDAFHQSDICSGDEIDRGTSGKRQNSVVKEEHEKKEQGKRIREGQSQPYKKIKVDCKSGFGTLMVTDVDDDFVEPISKSVFYATDAKVKGKSTCNAQLTVATTSKTTNAQAKTVDVTKSKDENDDIQGIRTRSSPRSLWEAVKNLSDEQKKCVRSMGFGMLLGLAVDGIPRLLGHYVVDNLDTQTMTIKMDTSSIRITKEGINQLIGVPSGGVKIKKNGDTKGNTSVSKMWRRVYGMSEVSPGAICKRMKTYTTADWMFRIDFLMLFHGTMVDCQKNGKCLMYIIPYLTEDRDVTGLDWCDLILSAIKECKDDWKRDDPKSYFTGPLTILTLFYVDSTSVNGLSSIRRTMPLADWTKEKLKIRQKIELEAGGFGKGKVRRLFVASDVGNDFVDEDTQSENMVHEPVKVAERLEDLITLITNNQREFDLTINLALKEDPCNEELKKLAERFDTLFIKDTGISMAEKTQNEGVNREEGMIVDEVVMSQFWSDPINVIDICRTVDQQANKYYHGDIGTSTYVTSVPSFSLGLTQEFRQPDFTTPVRTNNEVHQDVQPTTVQQQFSEEGVARGRAKRTTRLSYQLRSPYMNRPVDVAKSDDKAEKKIWEYLWRICGPETEVIFATQEGRVGIRGLFESFEPHVNIKSNVIECWSIVLNHEEIKGSDVSPRRLFCGCFDFIEKNMGFKDVTPSRVEAMIVSNIKRSVNQDEAGMRLSSVDLVLFPIKMRNHHFVVCFDLKNSAIVVIDSVDNNLKKRRLESEKDRDDAYIQQCNETILKLKVHFVNYLRSVRHPKSSVIYSQEPNRLKLKWATAENYDDSGIFTMRHMETYMGTAIRNWECGFVGGSNKQERQLLSLRKKYAAKILLSDINTNRDEILKVIDAHNKK